jgi:3-oxoacyl-[acyl-carrier-protein] synthase II
LERVVITGMGTINSLGKSVSETWHAVTSGVSGVGPITLFDARDYQVRIACEVKDFNPEDFIPAKEARRRDRFEQFATIAAAEAIRQAGLVVSEESASRVGVIVSSAIGGFTSLLDGEHTLLDQGPRRVSPFLIPMLMSNGAAGMLAIDYGFQGPSFSVVSACASGADGIGMAWTLLRAGVIDVALAGASEATITPLGVAAFDRIGATSRRYDDFSQTPQPFDRNRDGLVIGEGAGILVLERESHARQRGANILAELVGYASTSDAFHITAPSETGQGGRRAIRLALEAARVNTDEVDYINAHGTATVLNDLSETLAIKAAFGNFAYNIPVSSTKSMTGHMMGATGALEIIFCAQVVQEGLIPPTIHYQTPDPDCDLDYVPNQARQQPVGVAVSNAFGFGGHNAVLVVRRFV